ncbi:hypothetical protein K1T71_002197 [Dendrolimus kikuchii]|uniref:Uncharacterized protein n=1 Tax=Dendrolimus kikuchii TaxID=765133 RepID=A0ACC1DFU7_9NEOP|nr:hypothetical protein K1T71_002197 [Dendrolimus kikuchii]
MALEISFASVAQLPTDPSVPLAQSKSPVLGAGAVRRVVAKAEQQPQQQLRRRRSRPDLSALGDTVAATPPPAAVGGAMKNLVAQEHAPTQPRQMFAQHQPAKLSISELKRQRMTLTRQSLLSALVGAFAAMRPMLGGAGLRTSSETRGSEPVPLPATANTAVRPAADVR